METTQPTVTGPRLADRTEFPAVIDSQMMAAFVGPRAETYRAKWHKMWNKKPDPRKVQAALSWNWPAFLITLFWVYYRKMWGVALGLSAFVIGLTLVDIYVLDEGLGTPAMVSFAAAVGLFGNAVYLDHARKAVVRAAEQYPDPAEREAHLRRVGGTSWPAAIGGPLVVMVILFVIGFISAKETPEMMRAEVSATWIMPGGGELLLDLESDPPFMSVMGDGVPVRILAVEPENDLIRLQDPENSGPGSIWTLRRQMEGLTSFRLFLEMDGETLVPLGYGGPLPDNL